MDDTLIALIGRCIGDRTRLRIVRLLEQEPRITVGRLADRLGLARGSVFHHLRLMQRAGILRVDRVGCHRIPHLLVGPWMGLLARPGEQLRRFVG